MTVQDPASVHRTADMGVSGGGSALPHGDRIQAAFGAHDVSGIRAHTDGAASEASERMGAEAYATGDHIAFRGQPTLHTAAHEAAHVVQQRAGVHLKGGVGEEGDEHERHADDVADLVVAGQSAEALLDHYATPGGAPAAAAHAPVQGKAVQRAVKAKKADSEEVKSLDTLKGLFDLFALDAAGKKAFGAQMKTRLFATAVFPAAYKAQFDTNPVVKDEVSSLIVGVNDLIKASGSQTVISVAANGGTALADALFGIIGGAMDAEYVKAKCPSVSVLGLGDGLGGDGATSYLTLLKMKRAKLDAYGKEIKYEKHDKAEIDKNAQMENRITALKAQCAELEEELKTALNGRKSTAPIVAKMNALQADIAIVEKAIDLEYEVGQEDIQEKLEAIKSDETEHNGYANGGVDDGVSVGDAFEALKACSLYALLAVVPGFMGANNPRELHEILRKSKKLKDYDEDDVVAQLRFAAGLTPTMQGGRRLDDFITKEIVQKGGDRPSFIVDPSGEAHTFAAVWKDGAYRPRDNEADPNTDIMNVSKWKQITVGTTWKK